MSVQAVNEARYQELIGSGATVLLDFYADLLDEHTRGVMQAYYEDDLSLAEIAEDEGISRQGVRHIIKKGEEQLEFLESKLGLAERHAALTECCQMLSTVSSNLADDSEFTHDREKVERVIEIIMKGKQDVSESD